MEYNPYSLAGKTILVTGASSGIGKATAVLCAQMGATVILTARDRERLQKVKDMLPGEKHSCIVCDFSHYDDVESLAEALPILDGVVNSAGINDKYLLKMIDADKIDRVFKTNCFSPMMLMKFLVKKKKIVKGGSIVFLSSISSTYATISNTLYAASKGAINSMTRVMALELSSQKIRFNSIQPVMVNTEMIKAYGLSVEELNANAKTYPLGRFGEPEDIANSVIFLLSDASSWITGISLVVDGGITLR